MLYVLIVLVPIAGALLLYRSGFGRSFSVGMAVALAGSAILLLREPLVDSAMEQPGRPTAPAQTATDAPGPAEHGDLAKTAVAAARQEIEALRSRLAALEAERARLPAAARGDDGPLQSERAAHETTKAALRAAEAKLAASELARQQLAEQSERRSSDRLADRKAAEDTRGQLVLAEASIARLEAALRATTPVAPSPTALPFTPAPFSQRRAASANDATPSKGPASTGLPAATHALAAPERAATDLAKKLAQGLATKQFLLEHLSNPEVVDGRTGSYYRVGCSDGKGKRIAFEPGAFAISGGEDALAPCFAALQRLVLAALPQGVEHRLFVQGFASPSGFARAKRNVRLDAHLRNVDYLPHKKASGKFGASPVRQSIGAALSNRELPVLRAAFVAEWIRRTTRGGTEPQILEGALKPATDERSRSFDLILHVAWQS